MATLVVGAGGTPQGIFPHMKQIAAILGVSDRFMYFGFDVDQDIENNQDLLPEERFRLQMADREDLRQHAQALHLSLELLEYVHARGTRGVRAVGAFFAAFNGQELDHQIRLRLNLLMARGEREKQHTVVLLFSTEGGTGSSLGLYTLALLRQVAERERKRFQVHLVPVCPLIYNPYDDPSLVERRQASAHCTLEELFLLQEPGPTLMLADRFVPRRRDLCWLVEPDLPDSRLEEDRLFPLLARFIVEITEGPTAALLLSRLSNIEVVETPRTPSSAGAAYADPRI
jgi:hypothetical protein